MAKRKKAASKAGIIAFILLMLALTAGIFYFATRPKFVRYPAFGIDIPENYSIHGIDVSHHQSSIDWADVKAMQIKKVQIGFCFIKATEGSSTIDSRFRSNWRAAKNAGMIRGAYHFFNPNRSGIEQARSFIEMVKLQKGDLPPVLDFEQVSAVPKTILQKRVQDWLNVVEDHYKIKPIIYTGAVFYSRFLGDKFDDYPLWVAHYLVKDKPRISRPWTFWQHSELGHVNGITTFVDFNVFNGDSADFRQLLIK